MTSFPDMLEPQPRSEYMRGRTKPKRRSIPVASMPAPAPGQRSPLPSVREIDKALEQKYGAARYRGR